MANAEKVRAAGIAYREAHKAETSERNRAYRLANPEAVAAGKRAYGAANREKVAAANRAYYEAHPLATRARLYNVSEEHIADMVATQNESCAICARPFGTSKNMHMDHDHSCCPGRASCGSCVRDLLCLDCNRLLGGARDDVSVLYSAISYLERHGRGQ